MKTLVTRICLLLAITLVTLSSTAQAQVVFSVEGPITGIDPTAGTITACGVTVNIPAAVPLVGTRGLTGANLAQLLDAAAPTRVRSIFASATGEIPGYSGGTMIAKGLVVATANGPVYQAQTVLVEFAENVIVGPVISVDLANRTFVVNGATCRMNTDERFPANILDVGLKPITFGDLNGAVGQIFTVNGYFHAGEVHAVTVDTEVIPVTPNTDTVRITRANGVNAVKNKSTLTVVGSVAPFDPKATITITNVTTGAKIATVAVAAGAVAGQGDFNLKLTNLVASPTRIRATSSNGGFHELDVTIK